MRSKEDKHENPKDRHQGEDGNVFNLIGIVSRELKRAGEKELAKTFVNEAMSSGSYDEVLNLIMDYVKIE